MKVKEIIFMVEEDPEGGYTAKALGQSVFTEAGTLEELKKNLQNFSPETINQQIQNLPEEGIIFEPRQGKIRWPG